MPITVVNNTLGVVRCECNFHSINLVPGESMHVEWAYVVLPWEDPNVSIWFGGMDYNAKLCYNGNTITWDGHKTILT